MKKSEQNKSKNPFPEMEKEVLDFWDKAKTFEKSVERKAKHGDYVFYDGPPFATGMPHYGHIVASVMKDAVPRYWTMKGCRVERRWGWDCHGLPVENLAEQELKLKDKTDIEKIGIEKFNDYCHSIVLRYAKEWQKVIKRIGRWVDMDNDYKTMEPDYMESIWWVFKQLWDKGLIYQGHKAMHICPRCGTTLSNFEVTQNYKNIKDLSCIAKFELEDEPGTFVLAWTTTPWTLIGNVALAVGDNIDYVRINYQGYHGAIVLPYKKGVYILAKDILWKNLKENHIKGIKEFVNVIIGKNDIKKDLLDSYSGVRKKYGNIDNELRDKKVMEYFFENYSDKYDLKIIKGSDLIDKKYKSLFDYYINNKRVENKENGWKIYGAPFVTTEEGTGVVHIAPAFGEDDMELGKEKKLPFIQHVDGAGRFTKEVKDFAGEEVKPIDDHQKTDVKIIKYLAKKDLLFAKEKYEHSYPHCWRCETPLLNYTTKSWFVSVTKIIDKLVENNKAITWVPAHIKEGRFGKWLEQARDWAISRNRYWGAPLPVWVCQSCGAVECFGSREELKKRSGQKIDDLHKQFIDKIEFKCDKCPGNMKRIEEVLDCWFESGSMPYAQEHYPFDNKEKLEKNFPADFIAEGVDQTRGWFYTLHVLATALEINRKSSPAFKNAIVNGIVLAEDGQKMSKRLNNYPDPQELFEKYSVDAMRYYLLASPVLLAENLNFSEDGVKETLRKVEMLLWNVYKFYAMYEEKSKIKIQKLKLNSDNILDQWIVARLNQLITTVTENMDNYNIPKAIRPIEEFISDLSNWYLRRSRDRFKGDDKKDKEQALQTAGYVLLNLAKVMAPFMPFLAEQLWQKVSGNDFNDKDKSVHLEEWPSFAKASEGEARILERMQIVRKIVELGLAKRDEAGIRVRQPLAWLEVKSKTLKVKSEFIELIKDEVNIKEVKFSDDGDVLNVELDTELTNELKEEGIKREVVRFINAMRKNANMTIQDKAHIYWQTDDKFTKKAILKNVTGIMQDTLASEMYEEKSERVDSGKDMKVNGISVWLGIKKV